VAIYVLVWLLVIYVLEVAIDYFSDVIAVPTQPFL
jgi:hypothetical protein